MSDPGTSVQALPGGTDQQRLRLQSAALESAANAIVIVNRSGDIEWVNRAFCQMTGYERGEVIGQNPRVLKSGRHPDSLYRDLWETVTAGRVWQGQMINRRKDGSFYTEEMTITPVRDEQGDITHFIAVKQDISERKHHEQQLQYAATHDTLTGLHNRQALMQELTCAIGHVSSQTGFNAILFLDFDRFKLINDSMGHLAGDQLLELIAQRLRHAVSREASSPPCGTRQVIARIGGDEFLVLLQGIHQASQAMDFAEWLQHRLNVPFRVLNEDVLSTASIGVVLNRSVDDRPCDLIRDADIAMYRAKSNGRARCQLFDESLRDISTARGLLDASLRTAIKNRQLRVHYQPLICLSSGRLMGFEALVRWQHPTMGLLLPNQFLPVAEENGQIIEIGHWVLAQACHQLRVWHQAYRDLGPISLNLNFTWRQLAEQDLVGHLTRMLANHQVDPAALVIETCGCGLPDQNQVTTQNIHALRALGANVHMDYLGIGRETLDPLDHLPVTGIKIDQLFVANILECSYFVPQIRSMVDTARRRGLVVTAKGVENFEQLRILQSLGCHLGQGHFFGPPMSREQVHAWLAAHPQSMGSGADESQGPGRVAAG